jgi:hypothetical protein
MKGSKFPVRGPDWRHPALGCRTVEARWVFTTRELDIEDTHDPSDDETGGRHRWTVSWEQVECRCGDTRPRGATCDCGYKPPDWEIDQSLTKRRRRLQTAQRLLPTDPPVEAAPTIEGTRDELLAGLRHGMTAITALLDSDATDDEAAVRVSAGMSGVQGAKNKALALPVRRPLVALTRGLQQAGQELAAAIDMWIDAFTRAAPLEAQQVAELAQRRLDGVGSVVAEASERLVQLQAAVDASDSGVLSLAAARAHEMREQGWQPPISVPTTDVAELATTIWLSVAAARADMAFDPDSFWSVVRSTVGDLSDKPTLATLVQDDVWRADYVRHMTGLREADVIVEAVVRQRLDDRSLLRAELQRYTSIIEGMALFVLRTRLAVVHGRTYEEQRRHRLARILDQASAAGWSAEVDGIDRQLRNAITHEAFDVDEDTGRVVLDPGTEDERHMTSGDYVDRQLAALEVVSGLSAGLELCVMALDMGFAVAASRRAVDPQDFAVLLLGAIGQPVTEASVEAQTLRVSYAAPMGAGTLAGLHGLASQYGGAWTAIVAEDGISTLRVPLPEADDPDDLVRVMTAARRATIDGEPVATATQASITLITAACDTAEMPIREAIARLRNLRSAAVDLACPKADEVITTLIAARRQGRPEPAEVRRDLVQLKLRAEAMHVVTTSGLTVGA